MPQLSVLKEELTDLTTMKFISSALTEASAVKLKRIRHMFETNQTFFEEIRHLYHLIRIHEASVFNDQKKQVNGVSGVTIAVAVSSNQRFYGTVNTEIINRMLSDVQSKPAQVLVIGTTGIDYLRTITKGYSFQDVVFKKDFPDGKEVKGVLDIVNPYQHVIVYYPKFVSLVSQTVGKVDITQWESPQQKLPDEEIHIIFEPEFAKIVDFFETQVRTLLFFRVMMEADLARAAARLVTMSSAEEHSDQLIREKMGEIRKVRRSVINLQLLELFSGMKKRKKN